MGSRGYLFENFVSESHALLIWSEQPILPRPCAIKIRA
nr:MAG TPA: hypothetical protein [Caudoviricetes sp.]